jgi:ribose-phosphate pyrophosphokinase
VLAEKAIEQLTKAPIEEVVITDTIPLGKKVTKGGNFKVLTVSEMLGEAIKRIHRDESVSSLFDELEEKQKGR